MYFTLVKIKVKYQFKSLEKFIYPSYFMFLISFPLFAEIGGFENSVINISDAIRIIFPNLPEVIFMVGLLFHTVLFWFECRSETFSYRKVFIWIFYMSGKTILKTYENSHF